jgi:hypothetical protein
MEQKPKDKTHSNEFIEPAKLQSGTTIYLETNSTVYELNVLKDGRAILSSSKRKKQKVPCTIIGSTRTGVIIAGKILRDHHLILSLPKQRFTTGLIKGASVTKDKWHYDLWQEGKK